MLVNCIKQRPHTQLCVLLAEYWLPVPDEALVVTVDLDVRLVVERVQAAEVAVALAFVAGDAGGCKAILVRHLYGFIIA